MHKHCLPDGLNFTSPLTQLEGIIKEVHLQCVLTNNRV